MSQQLSYDSAWNETFISDRIPFLEALGDELNKVYQNINFYKAKGF